MRLMTIRGKKAKGKTLEVSGLITNAITNIVITSRTNMAVDIACVLAFFLSSTMFSLTISSFLMLYSLKPMPINRCTQYS